MGKCPAAAGAQQSGQTLDRRQGAADAAPWRALAWGVVEAVDAAGRDDNVWVVALTGAGDAFCAGLDLSGTSEAYHPSPAMTAQLDTVFGLLFLGGLFAAQVAPWG